MGWLSFQAQYAIALGDMKIIAKELSVDNCSYSFEHSSNSFSHEMFSDNNYIFPLYKISYMWYTFFATIFTMVIAIITSALVFGWNDPNRISPDLITPVVRQRIFKKKEIYQTSTTSEIKDTEF